MIRTENLVSRRVFFNPKLLRLELEMSKEQFAEYQAEIEWFIDMLITEKDEFQDKYIVTDKAITVEGIVGFMESHGSEIKGSKKE